jgi:hypothetical protein
MVTRNAQIIQKFQNSRTQDGGDAILDFGIFAVTWEPFELEA